MDQPAWWLLRQFLDVLAEIAVLRRLLAPPPGLDGGTEALDLQPGVVVVVLALDLVAREGQEPRDRVAEGAVPSCGDRNRARRVRRDHLDLDALRRRCRACAVVRARFEHLAQRLPVPAGSQPEVDESG